MLSRWSNVSLGRRLTLLYVGLLTVLLIALGSVVFAETRELLISSTELRHRSQAVPVIERWLRTAGGTPFWEIDEEEQWIRPDDMSWNGTETAIPPWAIFYPDWQGGPPPWAGGPPPWAGSPPPWAGGPPPWAGTQTAEPSVAPTSRSDDRNVPSAAPDRSSALETEPQSDRLLIQASAARETATATPDPTSPSPNGLESTDVASIAWPLSRDLTSRDMTALVFDDQGQLLANGRWLQEEPEPAPPDQESFARALAGEDDIIYTADVSGQQTLVTLIPLRSEAANDEVIGVVQLNTPLALADEVLNRERLLLLSGTALAILLGAAGTLWLTTSALAPLRRMIITSRRIAAGNLGERVNLPRRQDEVGQLAVAFDDMAVQIESTITAQRRFIADAAHELRTPLTALSGSLEVLLRGAQDDPASANRLMHGMFREVTRLGRLTEQLLDLTRLEMSDTIQTTDIDLSTFMANFSEQAQMLAHERQYQLQPGQPLTLVADPNRMHQALLNLVDNAVIHTVPGGKIRVGWRTRLKSVELWVADDGEGISDEDQMNIFQPFYRGKRSRSRHRGGSGLGLAIVSDIVAGHGGHISVESHPGQGTRFTITLSTVRV